MDHPATDLEACAQEPIHIPGAIQPHGVLFVLRPPHMAVVQASQNAERFLGQPVQYGEPPRRRLDPILPKIAAWHGSSEPTFQMPLTNEQVTVSAHRSGRSIILEIEEASYPPLDDLLPKLRSFGQILAGQSDIAGSMAACARFIAQLTGFDRVLVYRFDKDWNGHVVAEHGNGKLPSYLDLRFPAKDIPAQARALYAANPIRIIPNASYQPVPIEPSVDPEHGKPLDLSNAQLRSVSPVHLEYMRNMGTAASMSVSIMVNGTLWGLVSCHSANPHMVSAPIRDACDFVVQSLAIRIAAQAHSDDSARRVELGRVTAQLLASMTTEASWLEGLVGDGEALLAQVGASGAAIVAEDAYLTTGSVPREEEVRELVEWLRAQGEAELFSTASLAQHLPGSERFADVAAGVIAARISELHSSWLIWFRPEVVRTVQWGGDPHKEVREEGRIHPRKSFDAWREQVRLTALEWTGAELAAARDLRTAIVGIVLRKAEELASLSAELQRSNKELEAFSYSVSHDLRAPFRHIVGFAQLLRERESDMDPKSLHYLNTISESALAAGRLVDDLLNFSQLGRTSITYKNVDMNKLVAEVLRSVMLTNEGRNIDWKIADLPPAWGDATLLRQVWFNLIENAVKYTRPRETAHITVSGNGSDSATTYTVSDDGVGFDMTYSGKLFGVFQRLQRQEDFEGTGIGLALVRRIIERHNGTITATGEVDKGASFTFELPTVQPKGHAFA
ncbi:ATP-binding protein [Rhizobium sp. NTR19]|uniref:histidine kinase n=1 Tax=Neorhizobium turbinariae TaxID=2937795 RepID=A0ABT0INC8_9HYPH|nr:ATP-binding protein [Neorhizobium turbinariae]MCK8779361.1 ATP-binding protein [Neorhizobium turbinariae]